MDTQRVYIGGPANGQGDVGVPYPRMNVVAPEGVATYTRNALTGDSEVAYFFDALEPHPEPLATSMRLWAQLRRD